MYNYSPWLLEAKRELVEQLLEVAREGSQAYWTFDDAASARQHRHAISELRACLARNKPEFAELAGRLRTWIAYKGERYHVYVGVPSVDQRIRGAKPSIGVRITERESAFASDLVIEEEVNGDTWIKIGARLLAAKAGEYTRIRFTKPPTDPEGIEFLAKKCEPEFTVVQVTPHLVLEHTAHGGIRL